MYTINRQFSLFNNNGYSIDVFTFLIENIHFYFHTKTCSECFSEN